jgi:starch-binding outer membrane protein, SusD/RagB family
VKNELKFNNHMKNKILFISILTAMIFSFACSEKDLELQPTRENAITYYQQPENIQSAIWTAYYTLQAKNTPVWGNSHVLWGNLPSDDARSGGADALDQESFQKSDTYTSTPLDPAFNLTTMYGENFKGISACNLITDALANPTTDLGIQAVAEAKFVKALCYFYLVRMFGGLPILRNSPTPEDNIPRATAEETMSYIAEILEEAVNAKLLDGTTPALPQKSGLGDIPNEGRASLASAQALLGKVYVYQKEYTKAIEILLKIENSGNYILDPSYYQIFNPNHYSDECLFQVNYTTNVGPNGKQLGYGEIQLMGPRSAFSGRINDTIGTGWGFDQPTADLVNEYKSMNDNVRLHVTTVSSDSLQSLAYIYNAPDLLVIKADSLKNPTKFQTKYNGQTVYEVWHAKHERIWTNNVDGYWDGKHLPNPKNVGASWTNTKYNLILLRLADVYLLLAEAYNQSGNDGSALVYLNKVRERVSLPAISKSGSELFDAIKLERRLELALEGERYWDLQRWGDADRVLGPLGYSEGTPGTKTKGLFPIPQTEIDATGFAQNEGY